MSVTANSDTGNYDTDNSDLSRSHTHAQVVKNHARRIHPVPKGTKGTASLTTVTVTTVTPANQQLSQGNTTRQIMP